MHGNAYQKGLPDLLCLHKIYGQRWAEIKKPGQYLSAEQVKTFGEFHSCGISIYVLTRVDNISMILKEPANWQKYIRW